MILKAQTVFQSIHIDVQLVAAKEEVFADKIVYSSATYLQNTFYIVTIIVGILGLALGAYYFFKRIEFDKKRDKEDRQRRRMEIILGYLNEYDEYVCKILNSNFNNDDELRFYREKIINIFELIENYLEIKKLHLFSDDDLKRFLRFHSFVDKHPLISRKHFNDLDKNSLLSCIPVYREIIKQTRLLCLEKME